MEQARRRIKPAGLPGGAAPVQLSAMDMPARPRHRQESRANPPQGDRNLSETLDAIDANILDLVQRDAALPVAEIAERVGLSSSPFWRRIRRLEEAGVIQRRVTILDRESLGLTFEVYCTAKLTLPSRENLEAFEAAIAGWDEVVQCATVTGAADYELRVVTRDMHAFDAFQRDKLLSLGLVANIESRIVIRSIKNTTAVPLRLISSHLSGESLRTPS